MLGTSSHPLLLLIILLFSTIIEIIIQINRHLLLARVGWLILTWKKQHLTSIAA